jgi:hypothetical protein
MVVDRQTLGEGVGDQGASLTGPDYSAKPEPQSVSALPGEYSSRMTLQQYAHALQVALTGLAGGGSENFVRHGDGFRADIACCVAKVREREQRAHARYLEIRRASDEHRNGEDAIAEKER